MSVLLISIALSSYARDAQAFGCDGESCKNPSGDSTGLLQTRVREESSKESATSGNILNKTARKPGNLVVFFDGSGNDLDKSCWMPPHEICETNIALMYKEAMKIASSSDSPQLVMYDSGVGTRAEDSFELGTGTEEHAFTGYDWLAEHYIEGDKIFIFGFSRGTLSARIVQGMISTVGLAKGRQYVEKAVETFNECDDHKASAFKSNSDYVHSGVKIRFMGLYDAVLRTLFFRTESAIRCLKMTLTDTVENLAHAIALDEHREGFQASELKVHQTTHATQVWFAGSHTAVGGGSSNHGGSNIPLNWMAEQATLKGMLLPDGWKSTWPVNTADALGTRHGLAYYGDIITLNTGTLQIRNPARCRQQVWNGAGLKFHQSVQDRTSSIGGWTALPYCCSQYAEQMNSVGVTYVSDEIYQSQGTIPGGGRWVKISLGELKDVYLESNTNSGFYVKAQAWHKDRALDDKKGAFSKVTFAHSKHANCRTPNWKCGWSYWPSWSWFQIYSCSGHDEKKCDASFAGENIILPLDATMATGVLIEVYVDNLDVPLFSSDERLGRFLIDYGMASETHNLHNINEGTLELKLEVIVDDAGVQTSLGVDSDSKAACQWLGKQLDMTLPWLCGEDTSALDLVLEHLHWSNPTNCDEFEKDITCGS